MQSDYTLVPAKPEWFPGDPGAPPLPLEPVKGLTRGSIGWRYNLADIATQERYGERPVGVHNLVRLGESAHDVYTIEENGDSDRLEYMERFGGNITLGWTVWDTGVAVLDTWLTHRHFWKIAVWDSLARRFTFPRRVNPPDTFRLGLAVAGYDRVTCTRVGRDGRRRLVGAIKYYTGA